MAHEPYGYLLLCLLQGKVEYLYPHFLWMIVGIEDRSIEEQVACQLALPTLAGPADEVELALLYAREVIPKALEG